MDTLKEQYAVQNYYYKMCRTSIGEHLVQKSFFWKKCIVWKNPETGLPIAVLRDLDNYEIPLPNSLSSFEENFIHFQSLWTNLDFDLKLLYKDIGRHISNNNEQCDGCNFPFSPVCSELYCQFDPDPPLPHWGFSIPFIFWMVFAKLIVYLHIDMHLCIGISLLVVYSWNKWNDHINDGHYHFCTNNWMYTILGFTTPWMYIYLNKYDKVRFNFTKCYK